MGDAQARVGASQDGGFRNVLVHGYLAVDSAIVRDVLERRLGDIEAFVQSVRERLGDVSSE